MTDSIDLRADLDLALRAVRDAGAGVLAAFRAGPEVRFKSPGQPVTDADEAADRLLRERLQGARPDYGWLSEETADSPERLARRRLWVVDPIDGTNSFVQGIPEFVVSVGLVEDGRAVLGVLLNPATDELYHATEGGGAFLNGRPVRVTATGTGGGGEARTFLGSRSEMRRGDFVRFADAGWRVETMGSTAYRMAKVAEGAGDAFVSARSKHEWDLCAAALVLAEAGGRATDLDGRDLVFNRPRPVFQGIVATNGRLHAAVLETVHGGAADGAEA
ncbi:MAG TPA: 3'(2'),5'-bisphosphate nucleotidase CysQ [Longimicrobium sp.]|nr:3'(2'),5'-bisphosphate nucleotidase CysQ [Longimicrobium sp.]